MKKLLMIASALLFTGCATQGAGVSKSDFKWLEERTVMVLNEAETGGGTGTIVNSNKSEAVVLTNAHVCRGVQKGGVVVTSQGKFPVYAYTFSDTHDLCLINIKAPDLGITTYPASSAPETGDRVSISGHPLLRPQTVTSGNLSGPMQISMLTGIKPCTEADFKANPLMCILAGGMPKFTKYETVTTDAIIAPGSSGSAVYNDSHEIVALVFAGAGRSLSQGILVPWEYIVEFSEQEKHWNIVSPDQETNPPEGEESEKSISNFHNMNTIITPMIFSSNYDKAFNLLRKIKEGTKK